MTSGAPNPARRYAFGPFRFETRPFRLEASGEAIDLTPQLAQLLELLLQNAGEIVPREKIRSRLWPPDVHVDFDRSINFCVTRLRAALGDRKGRPPLYIETVPRRGYRFVAEVVVGEEAPEERIGPAAGPSPASSATRADESGRSWVGQWAVAVLILMLTGLGVGPWLATRDGEPVARAEPAGTPASQPIGARAKDLGPCDPTLPLDGLDGGARAALDAACWQEQNLGDNDASEAIAAFEVVLAHHPDFLPALGRLAELYALRGEYPRAVPLAQRALQGDPDHAVALFVLADAAFRWSFEWPESERLFQHGLKAAPRDLQLRIGYANLLSATGRHEQAVTLAKETAALAPHSLTGRYELAEELYLAGRFEEAIAEARAVVEIEPKALSSELTIVYSYLALGDHPAALAAGNRALEAWGWPPASATSLEGLWQQVLDNQRYRVVLDRSQLSERAFFALGAGRVDQARQLMVRACRERSGWSLPYYDVDPRFAPLREMPGLESLDRCLVDEHQLGPGAS